LTESKKIIIFELDQTLSQVLKDNLEEKSVPVMQEVYEEAKPQEEQKPVKKALLKLLKKGKYNAKYLEELVSPDAAKRNVYYNNYGYF
jgi:hypothetical protein